jgi:hypothetical protein
MLQCRELLQRRQYSSAGPVTNGPAEEYFPARPGILNKNPQNDHPQYIEVSRRQKRYGNNRLIFVILIKIPAAFSIISMWFGIESA